MNSTTSHHCGYCKQPISGWPYYWVDEGPYHRECFTMRTRVPSPLSENQIRQIVREELEQWSKEENK